MTTASAGEVHRQPTSESRYREEWMFEAVSAFQGAACEVLGGTHPREAFAAALTRSPRPRTRVEEVLLAGLLLEGAVRASRGTPAGPTAAASALELFFPADRVTRAIEERDKTIRAARLIAENYRDGCNVRALARTVASNTTTLRRLFRERFGMTIREYLGRVRICEAVQRFAAGSECVVAVARAVGYRSEKNFYRAVETFTGLTPAALRDANPSCSPEACGLCAPCRGASAVRWCWIHRLRSNGVTRPRTGDTPAA